MRKWWSNLEIGGIPDYPGPFLCQTNSGDRQVARLPAKPGMRDRRMQRLPLLDQKMPCPSRRTWRKWTGRPDMTHVSHRDRVTFHLAAESSQMVLQWLQKMISIRRQFRSGSSRLQPMPMFSSQSQAEAERQRLLNLRTHRGQQATQACGGRTWVTRDEFHSSATVGILHISNLFPFTALRSVDPTQWVGARWAIASWYKLDRSPKWSDWPCH